MYESLIPVKEKLESCIRILGDKLYEGEDPIDNLDEFNKLEEIYKKLNVILRSI